MAAQQSHVMSAMNPRGTIVTLFKEPKASNRLTILKRCSSAEQRAHHQVFLHICKKEQVKRFKQRLRDPARCWKTSESDYQERELWSRYVQAYEDVFAKTSPRLAPWYAIPSNHEWFRNLAASPIAVDTMKDLGMRLPKPTVDLEAIRKEYHEAEEESGEPTTKGKRT